MAGWIESKRFLNLVTPLGADRLLLRSFNGQEGISQLFRYHLDMLSEDPGIDFDSIVGQNITFSVHLAEIAKERYFNGHVSRFVQLPSEQRLTHYQAEVVPWFWFLTRTANCKIFQNMTVPDIVKQVFTDFGFTDFEDKTKNTYQKWDYCVQYRETAYNFVSRLLEHEGIFYFFKHESGKHTLVMGDDPSVHQPCPDQSRVMFDSTAMLEHRHEEDVIYGWKKEHELRTGKYALTDYNFETPSTDLNTRVDSVISQGGNKRFEEFDYPGIYMKRDLGDKVVKLRIQDHETVHATYTGESDCRTLVSGYKFDLDGYEHQDQNTTYVLTHIMHSGEEGGFYSGHGSATDSTYKNTFTAIEAKVPFRPPRVTPKPLVHGTQTAVVVGPAGEEIYTDKYGRVKVQFFWDRIGKKDENSSCWVRVSEPWAGKNWGGVANPRIGQEVVVDFLEGDPDRPLIVGRVYNAEQMPPYDLPGNQTQTGIKSRSSPGGSPANFNEIRMEDKKGSELLYIQAEKDMTTLVEHNDDQTVQNDRTIHVDGTHTETIVKDTTITVTTGKETNTVKQEIVVTSQTAHIHVTACTEIQLLVGSSKLLMKADGSIELSGVNIAVNGSESVKTHGGMVSSEADTNHNIKGSITVSEGSATNTVTGGMVMLNP
jgi:type VI secretion system secreted protein VgrG